MEEKYFLIHFRSPSRRRSSYGTNSWMSVVGLCGVWVRTIINVPNPSGLDPDFGAEESEESSVAQRFVALL